MTSATRSTSCGRARTPRSALATSVGAKGYHSVTTGPYTTR